jgi:hypothetical protein
VLGVAFLMVLPALATVAAKFHADAGLARSSHALRLTSSRCQVTFSSTGVCFSSQLRARV